MSYLNSALSKLERGTPPFPVVDLPTDRDAQIWLCSVVRENTEAKG